LRANREAKKEERELQADRCWFSDGGISSNFPIHLFDQPLPRWPTFGLNLRQFHPDRQRAADEAENVWMIESLSEGTAESLTRIDRGEPAARIGSFLAAIINTMQNWRDNLQTRVPGYRDRIVHVNHDAEEGGMNLEMEREVVERLARRGGAAGAKLRDRFTAVPGEGAALSWPMHRWTRYRSTMALVFNLLNELADAYRDEGGSPLADLVREPQPYYAWNEGKIEAALAATDELFAVAGRYRVLFDGGAPRPRPDLRIVPRM
ncbi:MAG TPA: hypothetical protein VF698_14385, partial [Thermoanaerobaculia bacterium]